jgi:hypothetical protein
MPYPSAYEAEPLDSAKRRALGTQYFKYGIPKATPLLGVPGATPPGVLLNGLTPAAYSAAARCTGMSVE